MGLTFQVPKQYCSLQHRTLLSPPDMFKMVPFLLWPSSFILSWVTVDCPPLFPSNISDTFCPGGSTSSVLFFLFTLSMSFLKQEYWSGFPSPSPLGHILSELSNMTSHSCVACHGMAHSFTELYKPLHHGKAVIPAGARARRNCHKMQSFQTSKVGLPNLPLKLVLLEI